MSELLKQIWQITYVNQVNLPHKFILAELVVKQFRGNHYEKTCASIGLLFLSCHSCANRIMPQYRSNMNLARIFLSNIVRSASCLLSDCDDYDTIQGMAHFALGRYYQQQQSIDKAITHFMAVGTNKNKLPIEIYTAANKAYTDIAKPRNKRKYSFHDQSSTSAKKFCTHNTSPLTMFHVSTTGTNDHTTRNPTDHTTSNPTVTRFSM